jgi:hypothetical protein
MYTKTKTIFLLLLCCGARWGYCQLSPGDLSKYHADLEGLLNCTKCHDLGEGISQAKCLACHTELKQRIDQNSGYHISSEVKAVSCIDCHNDHHGRNFEIIRFDQSTFDHELAGYKLEDAHAEQECIACHKDEFIADKKIRDKEYTFLGLDTKCSACHQDVHQGSLTTDCASCHDFKAFKPAPLFDHAQTEFPLKGKHLEVDCIKCHPVNQKNGQDFQVFNGLEFNNCTSCHEDEHDDRFGQNCVECHTEESWHLFKGMGNFDHNKTDFSLTGQHRTTDCFACHKNGTDNSNPFKEYETWKAFDCASCHHDVHETKLGSDCKICHSTRSFITLNKDHTFDHSKTDYPLSGKHLEVDCKGCHEGASKIEAIGFDRCNLCHEDYHEGQFKDDQGLTPDCAKCHTVSDFAESSFTIDDHNQTSFALEGAHMATPCFSCHLKEEEKWEFRNIGSSCNDCHADIHQGILDTKFYPEKQCQNCHTVNTWPDINFDHSLTNFALEGKHLEQQCNACHLVHGIDSKHQLFSGLTSRCMDCHDDIHQSQFLSDGLTDCNRCHGFSDWEASRFNHDETDFKLEGEHLRVDCKGCHKETQKENRSYINYQIEDHSCASCHL